MKGIIAVALFLVAASASAEMVNGYFRQNGTYVSPYYRTERDGNPYNNLTPAPRMIESPSLYQPQTPRYPQPTQPTMPSFPSNQFNNCALYGRC
jgi:hypothetical protein